MFGGESFPLYAEIAFIPFLLISLYLLLSEKIFFDKNEIILKRLGRIKSIHIYFKVTYFLLFYS